MRPLPDCSVLRVRPLLRSSGEYDGWSACRSPDASGGVDAVNRT
jgi:hypothetical protein